MLRGAFPVLISLFALSQIYWGRQAYRWSRRLFESRRTRAAALAAAALVYLFLFWLNMGRFFRLGSLDRIAAASPTLFDLLLVAPFLCWVPSSIIAFLIAAPIELARRLGRDRPVSPSRRRFLTAGARVAIGAPFAAGAYGAMCGRLDLEVIRRKIELANLPSAFHGFRIVQLSDIHIGPFMSEEQIREYADVANSVGAELIALTGDYLTWDREPERALVGALSGLRAPFGVVACLGNHDFGARAANSLTSLFTQAGVRMLRHMRLPLREGGDRIHVAGVDTVARWDAAGAPRLEGLKVPGEVNILLSHYPNTFDRAAETGFDLTLAGHTHGGQLAVDPQFNLSRLATPYVWGWFEKNGSQLYVNRGIGTIGVPIRVGARPEITVIELVRKG